MRLSIVAAAAASAVLASTLGPVAVQATTFAQGSPATVSLHGDISVTPPGGAPVAQNRAGSGLPSIHWWFVRTDPTQALFGVDSNNLPSGTSVVLFDEAGQEVWSTTFTSDVWPQLPYERTKTIERGVYRGELLDKNGALMDSTRVVIEDRWVPISFLVPGQEPSTEAGFELCSTIRWFYDSRGEAAATHADAAAVLKEIATEAGLEVKQVDSLPSANMTFRWEHAPDEGYAAVGGWEYVDGRRLNYVQLNSADEWARNEIDLDRMGLLRHEVLHAFGFGHVLDFRSLMSPIAGSLGWRSELGSGELDGLKTMYRPDKCTTDTPDTDTPDTDNPDTDTPDADTPDTDSPDDTEEPSIAISGERISKRKALISGQTSGLEGKKLRVRVKVSGRGYRTKRASPVVDQTGAFLFTVKIRPKKSIRIYVVSSSATSDVLRIGAWRQR